MGLVAFNVCKLGRKQKCLGSLMGESGMTARVDIVRIHKRNVTLVALSSFEN